MTAAVAMVPPHVGPITPSPPGWHRPIGDSPRNFLAKGAGTMSNSPRAFHMVSRRNNSSGHAEINAALYSSRMPVEPDKWVAGRWRAPWETEAQANGGPGLPTVQMRPATAPQVYGEVQSQVSLSLASSSRVSLEQYAKFYEVQTGSAPTRRVLDAYVASQALGVESSEDSSGSGRRPATTARKRRNEQLERHVARGSRFKEVTPRPMRDPSGHDPRGGAAYTMFAASLRDYTPATVRGHENRSTFEQVQCMNRPSFLLTHVGPRGRDPNCRSISDFGSWLSASGRELELGVDVPKNTSKSPFRNRI